MFLIQDNFHTETFLAWTSAMVSAIYIGIIATRFERWGGLSVTGWDAEKQVRHLSWPRRAAVRYHSRPGLAVRHCSVGRHRSAGFYISAGVSSSDESFYCDRQQVNLYQHSLQVVVLAAFVLRVREWQLTRHLYQDGLYPDFVWPHRPSLLGGMVTAVFLPHCCT